LLNQLFFIIVQVLRTTPEEFKKTEEKQKLPKPRLTKEVKETIQNILEKRLERYSTSLQVHFIFYMHEKKKKKKKRRY
jgi:Holliday junction resolvase RusA-like endonuclease